MRILYCLPGPVSARLGTPKVALGLARELRALGHTVDIVGAEVYDAEGGGLAAYVAAHRGQYDVVDYAYWLLPTARAALPPEVLFVARVPLLGLHRLSRRVSRRPWSARRLASAVVRGWARRAARRRRRRRETSALRAADVVVVNNRYDVDQLVREGVDAGKVRTTRLGLSEAAMAALGAAAAVPPAVPPVVAFVGTFDWRKGAADFPALVRAVSAAVPGVRFRLLGTRGLFPDREGVVARFDARDQGRVEVVPSFAPDSLAERLAGCAVGVFPSYLEGFGFGVLEMMAAGLPVVAYDAPGPPEMVPPELLVEAGDVGAMARRVVALLRDGAALGDARAAARARVETFTWPRVASRTVGIYEEARRALPSTRP